MIRHAPILFCALVGLAGSVGAQPWAKPESPGPLRLEDLQGGPATTQPSRLSEMTDAPDAQPTTPSDSPAALSSPEEATPMEDLTEERPAVPPEEVSPHYVDPEQFARRARQAQPVPITLPQGYEPTTVRQVSLPPEGRAVISRDGTVHKELTGEWYVIEFDNPRGKPAEQPRRLLPCRLLEQIEQLIAEQPDTQFRVSGETTNDGDHAYLLLRRVSVLEATDLDHQPRPSRPAETAATTQPTAQGQSAPAADQTDTLISQLLTVQPGRPVAVEDAPPRHARENVESVAPAGEVPFNPGKRTLVVDRVVRILPGRDGQWWWARFESDNTLREPPMRVLPGKLLTKAQRMTRRMGAASLRLRVSGEITSYKGNRYLLLRKLFRQRDMGQF
jgi:hypothetical protein